MDAIRPGTPLDSVVRDSALPRHVDELLAELETSELGTVAEWWGYELKDTLSARLRRVLTGAVGVGNPALGGGHRRTLN